MRKLFGTDGIRGLVGEEIISPEMGFKIGRALVKYCQSKDIKPKIIIGRDTRESGKNLEEAVMAGVASRHGQAISIGIIPTPGLAFITQDENVGAGLMISASHNDYTYNGFKVFSSEGIKISDEEESKLEEFILREGSLKERKFNKINKTILKDARQRYRNFLIDKLPKDFSLKGKKVVLDCAHGATFKIAPHIFKKLGAEIKSLFIKPDGKNINKNCGSQYTDKLKEKVLALGAQVGFAFDGDGDRLIAVDEKGNELNGDQKLFIYSQMLKKFGQLRNDIVVSTVMRNIGFINALNDLGIKHVATDVGDRQVYKEMRKRKAVLGGEESGHIIFLDHHTTGDGILSALMLLLALEVLNKPLSNLTDMVTLLPKTLVNVVIKKKTPFSSVPEIEKEVKEVENYLGKEGRVLMRYSGTEPLCRIMVEGRDEEKIKELTNKLAKVVRENL